MKKKQAKPTFRILATGLAASMVLQGIAPGITAVAADLPQSRILAKASPSDADRLPETSTPSNAVRSDNLIRNGSFEETVSTNDTELKKFWKNAVIPKYWDRVWDASKNSQGKILLEVTEEDSYDGGRSIHVSANDTSARMEFLNAITGIDSRKNYICSYYVKADQVTGTGFYLRVGATKTGTGSVKQYTQPVNITGTTDDWQQVVVLAENLPSADGLQLDFFADKMTGDIWVDQVEVIATYRFYLDRTEAQLQRDQVLELTPQFSGGSTTEEIQWTSSNPEIASVDENGVVTGLMGGTAVITAEIDEYHKASCQVTVDDENFREHYRSIRDQWRDRITGNQIGNPEDPDYEAMMTLLEDEASGYWERLTEYSGDTDDRITLWADLNLSVLYKPSSNSSDSVDYATAFTRLETMARAYSSAGCGLYQNEELKKDITDALVWMHTNVYNEDYDIENKLYGNWWHWQIGMPQSLCNIMILMYEELPEELIRSGARTLEHFNRNPKQAYKVRGWGTMDMTSANLMDTSLVSALRSAIGEDPAAIGMAHNAFGEVLPFVTEGDGFYEDGSCVQHTNLAYTGGYGSTLLSGIEKILFITSETPWEITDPNVSNVFQWIQDGYRPLFADGAVMDMVSGRGIARPSQSDQTTGRGILKAVSHLAELAPDGEKDAIKAFARTNIEAGIGYNPAYFENMSAADMTAMKNLLASAPEEDKQQEFRLFGAMDKAVYHDQAFSLGISMYSDRIASFEYGNGENIKGYHMSDGATYLYNGDQAQYADRYWPTVDPMRLAGITTDHTAGTISDSWSAYTSTKSWVGGSSVDGGYGSVGMDFEGENTSLTAKKSWFTFGDHVIALGAGISSREAKETETIVENRKIREDGSNMLWIDGEDTDLADGAERSVRAQWALLEGNGGENQNIGYWFPGSSDIDVLKEERTGSWREINTSVGAGSDAAIPVTRTYVSLAIPHGSAPANESYSYVLLPGKSLEEMEAFAADPSVEIISNTEEVQAARDKEAGVTGYNFWEASAVNGITARTPASLTVKEEGQILNMGISNPMQNGQEVTVVLDGIYAKVQADSAVEVTSDGVNTIIEVSGSTDFGRTYEVQLMQADMEEFEIMESRLYRQVMGILPVESYDLSGEAVAAMTAKVNTEANRYWSIMNRSGDTGRDEIFQGVRPVVQGGSNTNTANLTQTYKYLFKLAQAYRTNGTDLYGNRDVVEEVFSAIDFTIDNRWYGKNVPTNNSNVWYYGNWWDHRIGVPAQLLPIMVLLKNEPELTPERFETYMEAMTYQKADEWGSYVSANLADIGQNAMYIAVLRRDPVLLDNLKVRFGRDMFEYTGEKNGWHPDGSYVDHDKYAYTGGYGSVMIGAMSRILPILSGTSYEMSFGDERDSFYSDVVLNGYLPLHYNGSLTDPVRGRSITRQTAQRSTSAGHLALISEALDGENERYVKGIIKGWLINDPGILSALTRPSEVMACQDILNDSRIIAAKQKTGVFNYNVMDKTVQQNERYMAVVSMHSNQIANYEFLNTEGGKTWNISDGALFLYQKDKDAFRDNYWATVDHLRLPGTTGLYDTARTSNAGAGSTNPNTWVSGISDGSVGLTGMQVKTIGKNGARDGLLAKKSYFMLDGVIVAVGSDISGLNADQTSRAETIIENRKISADLSNVLLVNGNAAPNGTTEQASWAHLSGNAGEETGYLFFQPVSLETKKEVRTGLWQDINNLANMREDDNPVSAGYATMYINHGANPQRASYSYAVLPGKTVRETEDYKENPTVEILSVTPEVHAAYDRVSGTTGANFWTSSQATAGRITASRFATVLLKEEEDSFTVTLADPTHLYGNAIAIEIDLPSEQLISKSQEIEVTEMGDRTGFTLNAPGAGEDATFTVTFARGLTEEERIDALLDRYEEQLPQADLNHKAEIEQMKTEMDSLSTEHFTDSQSSRFQALKDQTISLLHNLQIVAGLVEQANEIAGVTPENADVVESLIWRYEALNQEQRRLLPQQEADRLVALKQGMITDSVSDPTGTVYMVFTSGTVDIRTTLVLTQREDMLSSLQPLIQENRELKQVLEFGLNFHKDPLSFGANPAVAHMLLPSDLPAEKAAVWFFPSKGRSAVRELEGVTVTDGRIIFPVTEDGFYGIVLKKDLPEKPDNGGDSGGEDGGNGGSGNISGGGGGSSSSGSSSGSGGSSSSPESGPGVNKDQEAQKPLPEITPEDTPAAGMVPQGGSGDSPLSALPKTGEASNRTLASIFMTAILAMLALEPKVFRRKKKDV